MSKSSHANSSKKKKILLFITNLGPGGAERVFFDHAIAFKDKYLVEEAVFERMRDPRIYNSGLPLHDLHRNGFVSKFGSIGRLLSRALTIRELVRHRDIDVVISHMSGANWVNVLSFSQARKVLVVHGTVLHDGAHGGINKWLRTKFMTTLLYRFADRVVAVSAGIGRELQVNFGLNNVEVIRNFFDLKTIEKKANDPIDESHLCIFDHPNILITAGRLSKQKRQAYLIDMLVDLLRKGINVKLVLLGDGELREHLLRKCLELKLRTFSIWQDGAVCHENYDIYFLGHVSNPYQYLARSTLFLFPSGWEGFPLALCEAMACGIPVISADCPTGPREILAPETALGVYDLREREIAKNGVLMPVIEDLPDLVTWTQTIQELLQEKALLHGLAARGYQVIKGLDREDGVRHWFELLEKISRSAYCNR